ncbi:MAG: chromosomal replication initiator protein DnaA [Planctomycetota bacterium]|nr:chromosomal replication initiator protein DnaA [Planctomycetota bacterium]
MSCISTHDPQLERLADAIAQRVGQQRFHVWFINSTRLDLKQDALEIAVPNDFISEWIGRNFSQPIQDAAHEVLGCSLTVRFSVVPQLFDAAPIATDSPDRTPRNGHALANIANPCRTTPLPPHPPWHDLAQLNHAIPPTQNPAQVTPRPRTNPHASPDPHSHPSPASSLPRLRHDLDTFVVGPSNQLAYNAALYVAEFPGVQYNPLFIHGSCGLGKTHLLQGLCKRFLDHHPAKNWTYLTGEEFTNEFLFALRHNKLDAFRRKIRDLDLLVIDDVHFLSGKRATQEEFLHTFNAIEALGKQVVIASDSHPKMIEEFGESLINRFVSGMVVRIDPPNSATRAQILRGLMLRAGLIPTDETTTWIARRVTQNVRELEGAVTRISALVKLTGQQPDLAMVQESLGDLERQHIAPLKPDNILSAVCTYFGLELRHLMSSRRQRTISLARSVAMHIIRKTSKLSFPEIGQRLGKRNHSTVISACRRVENAIRSNEKLIWTSPIGPREEEAAELIQRLEELSRAMN